MKKLCLAAVVGLEFVGVVVADTITSPYAKGGEVSIVETANYRRYVHTFTNTESVATFRNRTSQTLHTRCLVVGAGGAGGFGLNTASGGGGGGGGGGVWEREGIDIAPGVHWHVLVGKGAPRTVNVDVLNTATAGASSISNVDVCVALVPGGGNGGETKGDLAENGHAPTEGAAGGGGIRASTAGAAGTYASSLFGVSYGPFAGGEASWNYQLAGGGGGAGAAGRFGNGGEGLVSDITGEALAYGSGGGCGGSLNGLGGAIYASGVGGTRAGDGASGSYEDSAAVIVAPTVPAANSGCGGGGGLGGNPGNIKGDARLGTSGADGIVIIAYDIRKIPFEGGEVKKIAEDGNTSTYIHVFTNASEAATFVNRSGEDIAVRCLVVGAGGAGGFGLNIASGGGGGGGGGGVLDVANVTMPAAGVWDVRVGKGVPRTVNADILNTAMAGASCISNADQCVAFVPGGGNGGETKGDVTTSGHAATEGAAGGGGIRNSTPGAAGTYASSIFGVSYGPFAGATASWDAYLCGGGGGAGAAGNSGNGGEGLVSDITGESLVYGSGGGGGGSLSSGGGTYSPGLGGTRAGDGAKGSFVDSNPVIVAPTVPAANSGCGGAGGLGGDTGSIKGDARLGTSGADGIVVIRYDWTYNPNPPIPGMMLLVK